MSGAWRWAGRATGVGLLLVALVSGSVVGASQSPADDITDTSEEIDETRTAVELSDRQLLIGGASAFVGLGIGLITAGGLTYRRKRKQIRRRLQ